jgi:hypothetical protein
VRKELIMKKMVFLIAGMLFGILLLSNASCGGDEPEEKSGQESRIINSSEEEDSQESEAREKEGCICDTIVCKDIPTCSWNWRDGLVCNTTRHVCYCVGWYCKR